MSNSTNVQFNVISYFESNYINRLVVVIGKTYNIEDQEALSLIYSNPDWALRIIISLGVCRYLVKELARIFRKVA